MLFLYLLTVIGGVAWGFICLHRILCPTFSILPRFAEIRDLTKMETTHLLYILLSAPAVWPFFLLLSLLIMVQFLPKYQFSFIFGLLVALVFILAEFGEEKKKMETKFMSALKKDLLAPILEPGMKYPPYSPIQMRMACWRATGLDVRIYRDLSYECAYCGRSRPISAAEICFRGTRRRYVLKCDLCRQPSIIRIAGSAFSQFRSHTEAYVPRPQEEKQPQKQPPPPSPGPPRQKRNLSAPG